MKREVLTVDIADFGQWMLEKRKQAKIPRRILAAEVHVHENSIGRWERGDQMPPLDIAESIIKSLGSELIIREKNG